MADLPILRNKEKVIYLCTAPSIPNKRRILFVFTSLITVHLQQNLDKFDPDG